MTDQSTVTTLTAPNLTRLVAPNLTQLSAPGLIGLVGLGKPGTDGQAGEPGGGLAALVTKTGELTGKFGDLLAAASNLESGLRQLATGSGGAAGGAGGPLGGARPSAVGGFDFSNRRGILNALQLRAEFRREFETITGGTDLTTEEKTSLRDDIEAQSRELAIPPGELLAAFKEVLDAGVDAREAQVILKELAIIIGATRTGGADTGALAGGPRAEGQSGLKILGLAADLQAQRRAGGRLEVREIAGPLGRLQQDFPTALGGGADALREAAAALQFLAEGGRDASAAEADFRTLVAALRDDQVRQRLTAADIDLGDTNEPLEVGRILEEILRKSQGDKDFLKSLESPALIDALTQARARAGGAEAAPERLRAFRDAQGGVRELRDAATENAGGFGALLERGLTDILDFVESGVDAALDNFEPETRQTIVTGGLVGSGLLAGGLAGLGLFTSIKGLFGGGVTKVWVTNWPKRFAGFGDGDAGIGTDRRRGRNRRRRGRGGRGGGIRGLLSNGFSRVLNLGQRLGRGGTGGRRFEFGRNTFRRLRLLIDTAGGGINRALSLARRGAGAVRAGLGGGLAALTGTNAGATASLPAGGATAKLAGGTRLGAAARLVGGLAKGGAALLRRIPVLGTAVGLATGIGALTDDSLNATQKGRAVGGSAGAVVGGTLGLILGPAGAIAGGIIGEQVGGLLGELAGGLFDDGEPPVPPPSRTAAMAAQAAVAAVTGPGGRATPPTGKLEIVMTFDRSLEPRVKEVIEQGERAVLDWINMGPTLDVD